MGQAVMQRQIALSIYSSGNEASPMPDLSNAATTTPLLFDTSFAAVLFDMDGTILSSIAAAERVWAVWATRHGLDPAIVLPTIHGVRAIDTIRRWAPAGTDAEAEAAWVEAAEIEDVAGIAPIAGAVAFLEALPADRWAIVTSAPVALARRRLMAAGITPPRMMVAAEDVSVGKPDPEGYRLAAARLGVEIADCLVFEDAPAGIRAGEASGATLAIVTATHTHPIATSHVAIVDYAAIEARTGADGRIAVLRRNGSTGL
jgi:mannitol-1-/sugar-/sorbitol-6-phosphatase